MNNSHFNETTSVFNWKTFEKIIVETKHPLAVDSPDHQMPWGTSRDNSTNASFDGRFLKLYRQKVGLKVLDLGCSGGGFVKSCADRGCLAVGLEGSDYSLKFYRAEWPLLGNKLLFTADITKPFQVYSCHKEGAVSLKFQLITMWEVLEHLKEEDLAQTFTNVKQHLSEDGIFVVSVSMREEVIDGVALHQTVRPREWWLEFFKKEGFTRMPHLEQFFTGSYIRGPHNALGSENFIFSFFPEKIPLPPSVPKKKRLFFFR